MRRTFSSWALVAVFSLGAVNAFALETGIPEVDELIAALEADILENCASDAKDMSACTALLQIFAGLVAPAGFAALPGFTALVAANPALQSSVAAVVASPAFEVSFATTQAVLGETIVAANAGDPVFTQAIAQVLIQATGVNTAAGEAIAASPTIP
jgi:hypothetical protein